VGTRSAVAMETRYGIEHWPIIHATHCETQKQVQRQNKAQWSSPVSSTNNNQAGSPERNKTDRAAMLSIVKATDLRETTAV